MPKTELSGVYYPAGSQAPATAADLMAMAYSLDPGQVTLVADAADRDSRLVNAAAGKVAVTPEGWMWVKTSAPGTSVWLPVSTTETYTGFTWASENGFADNSGHSKIVRCGPVYYMSFNALYTGPDVVAGSGGFLSDLRMATISDPAWRPGASDSGNYLTFSAIFAPNFAADCVVYSSTGTINLSHSVPGATLSSGATGVMSACWVRNP